MTRPLLSTAFLVLLLAAPASAVIGIDLGSDFIKIAGIRDKKVDIILNEQSKRKSDNYIGFRGEDRFLGEDAYNLAPRFPQQMLTFINRMVGKEYDEAFIEQLKKGWGLPFSYTKNSERGTIDLRLEEDSVVYSGEELMSQIFGYVRRIEGGKTADIVVAIPSFYTLAQRQALKNAASLAGMNILSFIHHTTAAALQYGVQRRQNNNVTNLLIFDMGASRLEVGVYRFAGTKGRKTLGELQTLAIASDETLGGRAFDACIADVLAKRFEEKSNEKIRGETSKDALKAHTVLLRAANKAKEMLSANKEAPVAVEELYNGKPFFTRLTRAEMEEECRDLFARAVPTLERAIEESGLSKKDIDAFELVGGGVRIPRLQAALSEAMDGRQLDRTLNGDECISWGSAFYATQFSAAFRTVGYSFADTLPSNITFRLSPIPDSNKIPKIRPMFVAPKFGTKKSVTVSRKSDFDIEIFTEADGDSKPFVTFAIKDVNKYAEMVGALKEDQNPNNTYSIQVQIKLGHDGVLEVESATMKYDEIRTVQKRVKVKTNATSSNNATADGEENGGNVTESAANNATAPVVEYKMVNRTETKKHRKALTVKTSYVSPKPMTQDDFLTSRAVLARLQRIEDLKKAAAGAKNDLEAYIYWVKFEGFLDHEEMSEFITDEDREAVKKALEEVGDWLDTEGGSDGHKADIFKEKKKLIQDAVKPAMDRKEAKDEAERKAKEEQYRAEMEKNKKKNEENKEDKEEEEKEDKKDEKEGETAGEEASEAEEKGGDGSEAGGKEQEEQEL